MLYINLTISIQLIVFINFLINKLNSYVKYIFILFKNKKFKIYWVTGSNDLLTKINPLKQIILLFFLTIFNI